MSSKLTIGRKFIILATGMGLGKVIALAAMPLLTRLYDPSHFAELSLYSSIITLLSPLISLRLLLGIPSAKNDNTAYVILKLSMLVSFIFSISLMACIISLHDYIPNYLNPLGFAIYILPASIFLASLIESLSMYATRQHRFRTLAKVSVYRSTSETFFKISLQPIASFGLIYGQLAQQITGFIYLLKTQSADFRKYKNVTHSVKLKDTFYSLLPLVKYRIVAQGLVSLSMTMPIFFTTYFYSKEDLGQLSLAITAIALPVNLLSGGMSRVILAEVSSVNSDNVVNKQSSINRLVAKTFVIGFLPALLLYIWGGDVFAIVFGNSWQQAGEIASVLSIIMLFEICFSPCQQILTALNLHRSYLLLSCIRLVLYTLSLYIGYLAFDTMPKAMYIYAVSGAIFFLYTYVYSMRAMKNHEK